jgi:hypothetical protein
MHARGNVVPLVGRKDCPFPSGYDIRRRGRRQWRRRRATNIRKIRQLEMKKKRNEDLTLIGGGKIKTKLQSNYTDLWWSHVKMTLMFFVDY